MFKFIGFVALTLAAAAAAIFSPLPGLVVLLLALAALDSLAGPQAILATIGGSFANLQNGLKHRYDDDFFGEVGWSKGKLGAMIAKKAWDGDLLAYMMRVGNSPARSATFANAKTISEDATYGFTQVKQPQVPWITDYGRATIAGLLMRAASTKAGAARAYDKMVAQIDGIMDATMHSFSTKVYRDGFGCIGNISSGTNVATTTLTLAVPEDIDLYERGMRLVFSAANSTAVLRNSGTAQLRVVGLNYTTGSLTMSAAINTETGTVAGDFIFALGDRQDSATPTALAVQGLDAWFPVAAPAGGENFNNLGDRNNDGRLLANVIDTVTSTSAYVGANEEEALIAAVTIADRHGGKPRTAFFNPYHYQNLIKLGQGRFRPTTVTGPYDIGFSGVVVATPYGADVKVFSDAYCPRKRAFVVDMDTLGFYGVGVSTVPSFLEHDGNKILRTTDDDGVECRVGYYGNIGCNAPIKNSVIKLEA